MTFSPEDRFVRLPNALLEALLAIRLSGVQWRILLWVIRQTLGWNRNWTPFTWYRIAKDLAMDRGGVVRAGHSLLRFGILCSDHGQIGIQEDLSLWLHALVSRPPHKAMTDVSADGCQRKAMTGVIATDDDCQRNRCQPSSLFRRAKDRCKDRLKTYKDRRSLRIDDARHRPTAADNVERRPLAGPARPIPGKYDSLSEN
jgi:phage replication O-like protein O